MSIETRHSLPGLAPLGRKPWQHPAVWVGLLVVALVGVVGWRLAGSRAVERVELPVMATVPAFEFVDQSGAVKGSKALTGHVWVANFIFTRCPNICPKFTAKMSALQDKSATEAPELALVSFTVDPEHDTPEVLQAYGTKHGANFARWSFLRGERPELERVIREGMMQPMDMGDGKDLNTVVHGSYFALIDRELRVRGVYRFSEPGTVDAVLKDAKVLLLP